MTDVMRIEIARLTLAPGDILVIKSDIFLSMEQVAKLRENLQGIVGPDVRTLVLNKGFDLAVLTRAEIEARTA